MSLFPSETTTMNATVYCTRWWIRQRFITTCIQDYNSTYSQHNWYVYVLYSGVMTTTRGGASLETGGGVISQKLTLPNEIIWSYKAGETTVTSSEQGEFSERVRMILDLLFVSVQRDRSTVNSWSDTIRTLFREFPCT